MNEVRETYFVTAVDYLAEAYKDLSINKVKSFDQVCFNDNELCYFEDAEFYYEMEASEKAKLNTVYEPKLFSYIDKVIDKISNNSKFAILVNNEYLDNYAFKDECQFTRYVSCGWVESIIELPTRYGYKKRGSKKTYYNNCSIVIISKNNDSVSFVQMIRDNLYKEQVNIDDFNKYCSLEEFDSLLSSKFVFLKLNTDAIFTLGSICNIRQGMGLGKLHDLREVSFYSNNTHCDMNSLIFPVGIRNIQFPSIMYDIVPLETSDYKKYSNWTLKENDMVVPLSGFTYHGAIVDEEDKRHLVATNNIAILTPGKSIVPEYILAYLMSDIFIKYLETYISVAKSSHIGVKFLQKAPLPCASLDECTIKNKKLMAYKENIRMLKIKEREIKAIENELGEFQKTIGMNKTHD